MKEAGVYTVMGAYNKFRGHWCCHNEYLLDTVLKSEWEFTGLVVSDWAGVHDLNEAAHSGIDIEMGRDPKDHFMGEDYLRGLEEGKFC